MESNTPNLTSSEIASLWESYINDTLMVQTLRYALNHVEDMDIRSVLDFALRLSQEHIQYSEGLFRQEQMAIPDGFSEEDVNLNAAQLFTDNFFLKYIENLGKLGMTAYSMAMANAARPDIISHFKECLSSSSDLLERASQVKLNKGIFTRAPYIPVPESVEYVTKQDYLSGGWFSNKRPLNAIEISNLYFNIERNTVGSALIMGFSQVARLEEVRKYMTKGLDIAEKHVKDLSQILTDDHLSVSSSWDVQPTDSTDPPFSDKLMMYHITMMNASGVGSYGAALGSSQRRDLAATYTKLTTEIAKYSEDGANLMIENGWMEKPPQAPNREQ